MLLTMFCVFAANSGKSAYPNLVLGLTQQDCFATMRVGARNTVYRAVAHPTESGIFCCLFLTIRVIRTVPVFGWGAVVRKAIGMARYMFRTPRPPYTCRSVKGGYQSHRGDLTMSKLTLSFNNTQFHVVKRKSQIWLTSTEIAKSLGYKSDDAVTRIYMRNSDEFADDMSQTVKLTVSGNLQKDVRIFSLRGAHLVGMFARTPIAKDFRKWVLDILDKEASNHQLQKPEKPKNMLRGKVHKLQHACEFICGSLEMRVRIPDTLWQNHPLREGDQIYFEYPQEANPMIATPIAIHTNKEEACTSQSK